MDFLERLLARAHTVFPLKAGSLSNLAADARSAQWIDQCVADMSTREASFATDLLLRALQVADSVVAKIEAERVVLNFFAGTSRDILIYESLQFSLHALSAELRRTVPADMIQLVMHISNLACTTACELGRQAIGDFDPSTHRLARAQRYLPNVGNLRQMAECLIDVLAAACGSSSVQSVPTSPAPDMDIEVQVTLRAIVHAATIQSIGERVELLISKYAESSEDTRRDGPSPLGPSHSDLRPGDLRDSNAWDCC